MKVIALTRDKHTIIDDEDYPFLSQSEWSCVCNFGIYYAIRSQYWPDGTHSTLRLHREVLIHHGVILDGAKVDHKNGNGLDNRKRNLRLATCSQNKANGTLYKNNASGLKGVYVVRNKFRAQIRVNGRVRHLGYFDTAADAANAYDLASIELFGEFAKTNQMLEDARC